MSYLNTNYLARTKQTAWIVSFLIVITVMLAAHQSTAQALQKGINVELARTSSAVPVPDADNQDALIITVTDTGKLYFGIDPVAADSLAEKLRARISRTRILYVKADARAPYASVVKVLDVARTTDIAGVTLLTTQPKTTQAGTVALPQGIEMELARHAPAAAK